VSECAMRKKDKDDVLNDYQRSRNEIIRDKVDEIFRTQPDNYISALEKIGFKYYDDDDPEEIEEKNAKSENQDQPRAGFVSPPLEETAPCSQNSRPICRLSGSCMEKRTG